MTETHMSKKLMCRRKSKNLFRIFLKETMSKKNKSGIIYRGHNENCDSIISITVIGSRTKSVTVNFDAKVTLPTKHTVGIFCFLMVPYTCGFSQCGFCLFWVFYFFCRSHLSKKNETIISTEYIYMSLC